MFKSLSKSKYPTGLLYFLTEHTFIIYVQYIKRSKRKTSYLLEKLFEKDLVHFVSDSIFKRLKFDYSASETVLNQKIKIKNWFLMTAYFWRSDKVSKGAKIRNRYNQVPHLTQDTNGKVTNSQKTPQTRAKRSALSQQVTTKHTKTDAHRHSKHKTEQKHKRSTKEVPPWNGQ